MKKLLNEKKKKNMIIFIKNSVLFVGFCFLLIFLNGLYGPANHNYYDVIHNANNRFLLFSINSSHNSVMMYTSSESI